MYRDEFKQAEREFYWSAPRVTLALLAVTVGLFVIGFVATGGDFLNYKFWAPKQEAARRQVYEQSKAYRQGSTQRLNTLCEQVASADPDHKALINDVIAQEFAEWNSYAVPDYLRGCLSRARGR